MASTPCGFCGFNNAVVAAHAALEASAKKILIVNFDLHHDQGTQQAFYSDPRVVYMSVHRYENGAYWPHLRESCFDFIGEEEGKGFNVNVALNSIGGPSDYLAIFHTVFLPIAIEFQPDLVLISAGYATLKLFLQELLGFELNYFGKSHRVYNLLNLFISASKETSTGSKLKVCRKSPMPTYFSQNK